MNKILHVLTSIKPSLKVCELFSGADFEDIKYKTKESSSPSEVFFGKILTHSKTTNSKAPVALKMWFNWTEIPEEDLPENVWESLDSYYGLMYEKNVYTYIDEKIIIPNLSPNFIPVIAFGSCDAKSVAEEIKDRVYPGLKEEDLHHLKQFLSSSKKAIPGLALNLMLTGSAEKGISSFDELIDIDKNSSSKLPLGERKSIIFQALYSLYLMQHFKINHNDLHFTNVLVQSLSKPIKLSFQIGKNQVAFETKYLLKFFDWDRAYVKKLGKNPYLSNEAEVITGSKNFFQANRDFYQFLCNLHNYENFWDLITPLLPDPSYEDWSYGSNDHYISEVTEDQHDRDLLLELIKDESAIPLGEDNEEFVLTVDKDTLLKIYKNDLQMVLDLFGEKRFENHDKFLIKVDKDATILTVLEGWYCRALHHPTSDLLYPLKKIFANYVLFDKLIDGLNIVDKSKVKPENLFVFPIRK